MHGEYKGDSHSCQHCDISYLRTCSRFVSTRKSTIQDSVQKIILYFFHADLKVIKAFDPVKRRYSVLYLLRFFSECRVKVDAVVSVKTTADDTDMIVTLKNWSWSNRE